MDPTLKFVIESACWTGVILLGLVAAPAFGARRLDWFQWVVAGMVVVSFIVGFAAFPWGSADIFPAVVGLSVFATALIGSFLAAKAGWRLVHRGRATRLDELAAINFGAMAMYFLVAAACLFVSVMAYVELRQGDLAAYEQAPVCGVSTSGTCRSQVEAIVVRTWAEGSKAPRLIEVRTDGRLETIGVRTAWNVWETLVEGQRVQLISWKGKVTAVAAPGVGIMQTEDSPSLNGFIVTVMGVISLLAGLCFGFAGLVYAYKCWAATRGDDTRDIDLAA